MTWDCARLLNLPDELYAASFELLAPGLIVAHIKALAPDLR